MFLKGLRGKRLPLTGPVPLYEEVLGSNRVTPPLVTEGQMARESNSLLVSQLRHEAEVVLTEQCERIAEIGFGQLGERLYEF